MYKNVIYNHGFWDRPGKIFDGIFKVLDHANTISIANKNISVMLSSS